MPKPVFLMTVQEAHKEYNSLTDQIRAKYEQLDSDKFGSAFDAEACELAFDAEACELANLLAHVSQHCTKLNLPPPKELCRPTFFKHWRLFDSKLQAGSLVRVWRMQLCRYVRITGLLSAPLVLRIGDWLCVLPAITHVFLTSPRKLTKLPPQTDWWWTATPPRQKAQIAFPPGRGERPCIQSIWHFWPFRHE